MDKKALNINGNYIENLIDDYHTLYVKGREMIDSELDTVKIGFNNGEEFKDRRYKGRTLKVGFAMRAKSSTALLEKFNKLNEIIGTSESKLIFADEQDKFYIGTRRGISDLGGAVNTVTGEIEFYCSDPFKYSVKEYEAVPTLDEGKTFAINYAGTHKAYPVIEATMPAGAPSEEQEGSAECGFIAYINEREKVIQIGNPDEVDGVTHELSQKLVWWNWYKYDFDSTKLWKANQPIAWPSEASNYTNAGTIGMVKDGDGVKMLGATSYGPGLVWRGANVVRVIPADKGGVVGAVNGTFAWNHLFCSTEQKQRGLVSFALTNVVDGVRKNIATVTFSKNHGTNNTGYVYFYVNGKLKKEIKITTVWSNSFSGYGHGYSSIEKMGKTITFRVGGRVYKFVDSALANVAVNEVSIYFGKFLTFASLGRNGVYWAKFTKHNVNYWEDVPNKFDAGDIIVADCNSAEIMLNGVKEPGLGVAGNDWEGFYLTPGMNQIGCFYSDWATNPPTFKLKYREAYL